MARNDGVDRTSVRNLAVSDKAVGNTQQHNEREKDSYRNPDIIPQRAAWNVHFKKPTASYTDLFAQLEAAGTISTRGLKPDATHYCELVFDVNSAYFDNHGGYEFAKQFYADAYKAAIQIVGGEQYILSAVMHADEINRATPKTQSSLLECMAERQITVDGVTRPLEEPFLVIATQNPLETLGTFPLPEAQMDRFLMKLSMEALSPAEETQMIARFLTEEPLAELSSVCQKEEIRTLQEACKEVYLHPELVQYLVRIVQETRVNSKIASGVSPRGTLAFLRAVQGHALVQGRNYVVPEDFKTVAVPVLAHRLTMQIGADDGRAAESVIEEILNRIDLPTENWSGR